MTAYLATLLATVLLQAGGDFEASAALDRERVRLGECAHLHLDVIGDMAADCEVTGFAEVPGLYVERLGSRMFRREGGPAAGAPGVLVTRFRYRLYALAAGKIAIPSIEVTARGRFRSRTGPLALEVVEPSGDPDIRDGSLTIEGGGRCFVHEPIAVTVSAGLPESGLKAPRLHLPWLAESGDLLPIDSLRRGEESEPGYPIRLDQLGREAVFSEKPDPDAAGGRILSAVFFLLPLPFGQPVPMLCFERSWGSRSRTSLILKGQLAGSLRVLQMPGT